MSPITNNAVQDCFVWCSHLNGIYTANLGYKWLIGKLNTNNINNNTHWNWIWKDYIPEKIKILIWCACHSSLSSTKLLHHRGMRDSPICNRCSAPVEDDLHILRDCTQSTQIWQTFNFSETTFWNNNSIVSWLYEGTSNRNPFIFIAGIWWAWRARNATCIANENIPMFQIEAEITSLAATIAGSANSRVKNQEIHWVSWHPSKEDGFILNVDGSCIGNPVTAGFGGAIRDNEVNWVTGFAGHLGNHDILFAELMALFHGLRVADENDIQKLYVYSDSSTVVDLCLSNHSDMHQYASTIASIKDLICKPWEISLKHTFREGNAITDHLAKIGASSTSDWSSFSSHPPELSDLLRRDALRLSVARSVCT